VVLYPFVLWIAITALSFVRRVAERAESTVAPAGEEWIPRALRDSIEADR